MRKKSFTLLTGIKVGEEMATEGEVREGTYGDQIDALDAGLSFGRAELEIAMNRVVRLGALQSPGVETLRLLTSGDWLLIEQKQAALDREIVAEMKAAGLLEETDGGREDPGAKTPGHS